ncbi:MAG TPA: peptide-N4-asparagine amidase [Candidatus Sulfotelmatobacter sp.]|nr:peptide-N4-asparagine amidase [Candidatus Sulfotelmatobacter sp.]
MSPASRTALLPTRVRNLLLLLLATTISSVAFASGPYVVGSSNTVTADPTIPRPSTTPCVVQILNNAEFDNFNPVSFSYAPPADCPGPWAKVVFTADINVTAGIQYDRTANFWLGPTNIYFGTTAEPSPSLGPSWHVESDLTDYTPLFMTSQQGTADIGNLVNSTYTGIIFATSSLEFYPLAPGQTAPVTANQVYSLSAGPTGGTVALSSTSSTLAGTFTLPTNIQNAYLDVYAQSQYQDEFWYTCVPNDVSNELFSCGNTAFRETEITIDGSPAGVAPIFPWIFTGGIDPYLWFPLPGVQTLNFTPYRVDLTPFAATLSNGQPHTISLSVFNSDNYFSATASLLVYQDLGSTSVTGALTKDTLTSAPNPVVTENLKVGNTITGTVKVVSNRNFTLSGYVNTSHGKVTTTISQSVNFRNSQNFNITNTKYVQDINQSSTVNSTTTVSTKGQPTLTYTRNLQFPLNFDISQVTQSNGDIAQTSTSWQTYNVQNTTKQDGLQMYLGLLTNAVSSQDTLTFDSSFNLLGNSNQASSQLYNNSDSTGVSEVCTLTAANNALTSFSPSCSQ